MDSERLKMIANGNVLRSRCYQYVELGYYLSDEVKYLISWKGWQYGDADLWPEISFPISQIRHLTNYE